jgi:hypothetical protein
MLKSAAILVRLGLIYSCVFVVFGCRTTLKPISDTSEAIPVEIEMIGLRPADQARPELLYTLSRCGISNVNGIKGDGNVVIFKAQGVKKDDECEVKVESGSADIGVANWKEAAGLMYVASRVKIISSEGKLSGLAFVQQKYVSPPTLPNTLTPAPIASVWKLRADLATQSPVSNCTCTITCQPALLNNVAMYEPSDDDTRGHCEFANLVNPDAKTTSCKAIMMQCGSDFYLGTYEGSATVDGSAAGQSSLPQVILNRGNPEATSDATIEIVIPQ